jgi:hypothetical protein
VFGVVVVVASCVRPRREAAARSCSDVERRDRAAAASYSTVLAASRASRAHQVLWGVIVWQLEAAGECDW